MHAWLPHGIKSSWTRDLTGRPYTWQVDALPLDHWETLQGRNYGFQFTLFLKLFFFIEIMLLAILY